MNNIDINTSDDLAQTISEYGNILFRICLVNLKDSAEAEDVCQETFIKYYILHKQFENNEHKKAWLIKVAVNNCRDKLKFKNRFTEFDITQIDNYISPDTDSGILEALLLVPDKFRSVLELHYVEGYKVNEISKMINISSSAVKMRLKKGRNILENIYRKEFN